MCEAGVAVLTYCIHSLPSTSPLGKWATTTPNPLTVDFSLFSQYSTRVNSHPQNIKKYYIQMLVQLSFIFTYLMPYILRYLVSFELVLLERKHMLSVY